MIPDVTVVIPNYNYAKYIGDCIKSVMNQSQQFLKIQIMVVDDCSTDNSVEVVKNIKSGEAVELELHKLSINHGNGGYYARNEGIKRARAPRIICLDADDMLVDYSLIKRCLALSREYGFVVGRAWEINQNNSTEVIGFARARYLAHNKELDDHPRPLRWMKKPNHVKSIQMSTLMCWTELHKKYGLYNTELKGWNDRECWQRWLDNGELGHFLNEHVSFRRIHADQVTKNLDYIGNPEKMTKEYFDEVERARSIRTEMKI